jgi:hypothetical protein
MKSLINGYGREKRSGYTALGDRTVHNHHRGGLKSCMKCEIVSFFISTGILLPLWLQYNINFISEEIFEYSNSRLLLAAQVKGGTRSRGSGTDTRLSGPWHIRAGQHV